MTTGLIYPELTDLIMLHREKKKNLLYEMNKNVSWLTFFAFKKSWTLLCKIYVRLQIIF